MAPRRKGESIKSAESKETMPATKDAARSGTRLARAPEGSERHLGHLDSERTSRLRKRQTKF